MADSTRRNRSANRRWTEREPPDDRDGGELDDWQWDDIEWSEGEELGAPTGPSAPAARRPPDVGVRASAEPDDRPSGDVGRAALVHRRRVAALVVLGVLFACALIIPLVVFGGGGGTRGAEQTTASAPTSSQTTTTARSTTPTTTATQPTTTPGKATLRLVLAQGQSLRQGDHGSAVVTLQKGLAALGFAAGRPDGVFGPVTRAAVVDFQTSNSLTPDGVVGSDTARLLNSALARKGVTR
jgi:hypothetical protein